MEKHCSAAKIITVSCLIISVIAGMTVSSYMLSRFMLKVQRTTEKSIKVKGVAEKEVMADLASFECSVSATAVKKDEAYIKISNASNMLKKKLDILGFAENMRFDERISCSEEFKTVKTTSGGKTTETTTFSHYKFTYSLSIRTENVDLVSKKAMLLNSLIMNKLDVYVSSPEYYISNPEQYKLELVDLASASAAERARVAAKQSGSTLGPLMTARQGVIQITSPASTDTSDYGVYNTSSPKKIIRLVMTMEFSLK